MRFGKGDWRNFEQGIQKEWLVTNGIGGYAGSTIINANTRRYHGLLLAAHNPPGYRVLQWVKLDEMFFIPGRCYNLATNERACEVIEFGFVHLQQVTVDDIPTFVYSFGDITLEKQVFMVHGQNTTVVLYRVQNGVHPGLLRLTPMVNCRGHHFHTDRDMLTVVPERIPGGVMVKARDEIPPLRLLCREATYCKGDRWFTCMTYAAERERGERSYEDHYIPGHFEVALAPGEYKTFAVIGTVTRNAGEISGETLLEEERRRISSLVTQVGYEDTLACRLVRAADAFVVQRRSTGTKTVIAGYPWFTDWGRDTMIALPGLTLCTGRYDDAREILITFARYARRGLLPNAFGLGGQEVLYNTVDASLWYFQAVHKFLQYTGDYEFIRQHIYPVLKDIIAWYVKGTDFGIGMDEDGLIKAGTPGVQLTWMDAKVGDWVVTPRHGKPVEIQALWYNALKILQRLAQFYNDEYPYEGLATKVRESFQRQFWLPEGWLCDVVGEKGRDRKVRPNQLLAVSLPYAMLDREQGYKVFHKVWQELYATYGIRSLAPDDPDYRGVYKGDRVERDGSYHQGTAWSWLIGPFVTACRRVNGYSKESRRQAAAFIIPFRDHLRDHGVGYISEIFDGNEPVIPRGCIAQAWGVAEILRVYVEEVLEQGPNLKDHLLGQH
ncbi:MAG: amylo-alpha-1,6-glucosidase [Peptococcaceae bacterium]|nr:amylo-alpha-1,6-glucosidase [Peptococcaceae bacterium]